MGKTTSGPDHEYTNHGFIRGTQVSRGTHIRRGRLRPRASKPRIYPWYIDHPWYTYKARYTGPPRYTGHPWYIGQAR
jgi:hypothetical protein